MSGLQRRVERIEQRCGIGPDEETVELPMASGQVWRMTEKESQDLLKWIQDRNRGSGEPT